MQTYVEFRSDLFPPYDEEEKEVNPGIWGKRLAEFLRDGLRGMGIPAKEPFSEDWGWVLPIANKEFRLLIGCGNYPEYPDGFLCFIQPHTPFVRKFPYRKIDTRSQVTALQKALDSLLSDAEAIRSKRWWTYEEFSFALSKGARFNPTRDEPDERRSVD